MGVYPRPHIKIILMTSVSLSPDLRTILFVVSLYTGNADADDSVDAINPE